jgi:FKBP-type peptidyl-prolyl cis-trans isomerase
MKRVLLVVPAFALAFAAAAVSDDTKSKLPPLDSKEWKKLDSGLEIWDVQEGKGTAVAKGATVKVRYTGWLTDGKVFDSAENKEPVEFPLGNLIKAWQEGIPGMKPGGVRRLKVPPKLGYGDRKTGPIPPNSTLVFEIELVSSKE